MIVVVPLVAPREIVVATPPMLSVVAVVFKRLKVDWFVVKSPPFMVRSAPAVTLPVRVELESIVSVPLAWISPLDEIDTPLVP